MKACYKKIIGVITAVLVLGLPGAARGTVQKTLTARSAIVIDADRGTVLYQKNPHRRLPAASTVKVLTALIAVERLDAAQMVSISNRAAGIAPSKAYLTHNAGYTAADLLKCLLMSSANDAGVALAEAIGGTEIQFSSLMNKRAKALGARNSFFLNATGLPEGKKEQYSTVYDLSLILKKSITYSQLVEIMKTKRAVVDGSDGKKIYLRNHNKFLKQKNKYGLIGKTGYTLKAKHCFLGMFTKGKRRLIVAIQGSRRPWDDLDLLMNRPY
ncbi:MAG: serine hydrolase [Candidatus Omnitrophica bacterium]|nr:serine hydrolase [Candidatus Omnitrophota bacterium]